MFQEILTLSIVAGAFGYFAFSMYRTFVPKKGKERSHSCPGCASGGCGIAPK
jgi:hypothetical protein